MRSTFLFIEVFILGEILAFVIFKFIRKKFNVEGSKQENIANDNQKEIKKLRFRMILIGMLERLTLFLGAVCQIPTIYVMFGALKVATRIQPTGDSAIKTNDYFLVGNFVSAILTLLYYIAYTRVGS